MLPTSPARINNQTNESFTPTLYCLTVHTVVHVVVNVILSMEECEAGYTYASYKKHDEQVDGQFNRLIEIAWLGIWTG